MGAPPLELTAGLGQLLWQQQQQHSNYADQVSLDDDDDDLMRAGEGEQRRRQRCRHRHFSLEDYQGHESEDSNLSSLSMGLSSCDNGGTAGATEVEEDANHSVLMSF